MLCCAADKRGYVYIIEERMGNILHGCIGEVKDMESIISAMKELPFVSVIIPTCNRADYISLTIDSFLKQSYPGNLYEIIICDNDSTDNTKEVVESYSKKNGEKIRYLFEKRQGLHYARNYAAQNAKGELLYYTDDDTIADINLLSELVKVFENDEIGCATGRILPKWECPPPKWVQKYCCNFLLSLNDLGESIIIKDYDLGVFGCHEAVRKDAFFAAGGSHPDLFGSAPGLGDGETGLNNDIKALGYKFAYVGTSIIYHVMPKRRMTQKYLNNRFIYNGNAESYTDYRRKPFAKRDLPRKIAGHLYGFVLAELQIIRERKSPRFLLAQYYYCLARIKYDVRIIRDEEFRHFVENNYWF